MHSHRWSLISVVLMLAGASGRPVHGRTPDGPTFDGGRVSRLVPSAPVPQLRSPRVWANRRSRVYHCPGSKWYGIGRQGAWMTEREAQARGYRPAYKRVCGT